MAKDRGKAKSFQGAFRLCLNKKNASGMELDMVADIDINIEIQFGERVGHRGWLIGPKFF